jgi:RNA polymerase-interacting CarD/CdnL/TRCF family regulator
MSKTYLLLTVIGLLALLGCRDNQQATADKAVQAMQQSFDAAPEELKTKYQAVNAALESNDILKAKAALDELLRLQAQFSPEQQGAVLEQKQALMLKAAAAAQNGDQGAARVIEQLRSQSRSR